MVAHTREAEERRGRRRIEEWDRLPVNSEPLAPLEPYRGETERQFLARAARHYEAREAALRITREGRQC